MTQRLSFKSYYVVWKPQAMYNNRGIAGRFKSYYVVWKPFFPDTIYLIFFVFKSYYVVWKPGAAKNMINGQPRLNRTM